MKVALTIPEAGEAMEIILAHDLTPLSRDGWAHLLLEHPGLAAMFLRLQCAGKINGDVLAGLTLMVGLCLQTEPVESV